MSQIPLTDRSPTAFICVICIDDLAPVEEEEEDFTICTPCSHVFHGNCLLRWMHDYPLEGPLPENAMGGTCPYCQSIIFVEDCSKIYLNSVNTRAHDEEVLRLREQLANAQAELEKTKEENNALKLQHNSVRSMLRSNTVAVVNGTNVDFITVTSNHPNVAATAVVSRRQIETMRVRSMQQLSPGPMMLQRGTGGTTVPPPPFRTDILTFGNHNAPTTATSTSGSVRVTYTHADQGAQTPRNGE